MTDPTSDIQAVPPGPEPGDEELGNHVDEAVSALFKALRARQTYVLDNPLVARFHDELSDRLRSLWERSSHLSLTVDEGRLLWLDREVYARPVGPDNVAFRLFRDGVRKIALLPGVEDEELTELLDVLSRAWRSGDEDLVAGLWHRDFKTVQIEYVDVAEGDGPEIPSPDRNAGAGEMLEDMSEIEAVLEAGPVTEDEEAKYSDIALGEPDLMYLRREMESEWARPLVHDVTLALLDQFEMRDQERRRQVVDILRALLPRLLSEHDFASVALIVNELQLLANKTGEDETQELVTSLLRDMSEAMAEMVSTAELGESPEADQLSALVGALQAEAIPTLVRAVPSVANPKTRAQLAEALDRLVSSNPAYVVGLLEAEDPMLAAEAARIIGRLDLVDAERELIALAHRPESVTRQAAIEALALLGSEAASGVLAEALADEAKEVRLAAVAAIGAVRPPGAEALLRSLIGRSDMARRPQSEQLALLKAYVDIAGDSGVPLLATLLNGRRWWGGKRPPAVRANAARALGIIGSDRGRVELEKAAADRATPVRNAVRVALRSLDDDADERLRAAERSAAHTVDEDLRELEGFDVLPDADGPRTPEDAG